MMQYLTPVTGLLVSDFDGTITRRDFYTLALEQLIPSGVPDYWQEYLAGRLTHFEALNSIFRHIHAEEETVRRVVLQMEIDPDISSAVGQLRAAGWNLVIASAGCRWYIDYLLALHGVAVQVHANPGTFSPAHGLQMTLPVDSPYFSPTTGIDKLAVMQDAVRTHPRAAFAGDGPPDLPAALLAPPERRFARGWLADRLTADHVPFHLFEHWSEIPGRL